MLLEVRQKCSDHYLNTAVVRLMSSSDHWQGHGVWSGRCSDQAQNMVVRLMGSSDQMRENDNCWLLTEWLRTLYTQL